MSPLSSGAIVVGGVVAGTGYVGHVVAQTSGTPGGVGTYSVWYGQSNETNFASEALTETYGVLTIGTVTSGTVAVGEQVTDATGDVYSLTAIGANLSGSGNGSTWVVETAQDVLPEAMTMTAAPLLVTYKPISGATVNSASFWIEENGNFPDLASSMTYASGTAAALLGLTQSTGAYLSTPGQLATSPSAWMSNIVQNESDEFSSFQTTFSPDSSTAASLAAWAQSTGGEFQYLENSTTATPPIVPSSSAAEIVDPAGTYSSAGASAPTPAAAGAYIPVAGATSAAEEIVDPAGTYSAAGASAATIDPAGSYSLSGASAPTLAQPGYYVPTAAPATRRRFRLAITSRTRARRASSWRCRRSYRARQRGNPRHPGNLTRRLLPSRSPIQTSTLQTVFRSRSRAPAARLPTARASLGSRRARPASTPCRELRP